MKTPLCIKKILKVFILYFYLFFTSQIRSQTTNIGGIINDYQPVTAFDTTGCKARLAVVSATAFSVGDSVLLIQMKGANFDSTNSAAFGSIVNLSGAGNYEIAAISSINSNTIMLNGKLVKKYLTRGYLQLVRIPCYVNANITASLTCLPWNGLVGGVLIFSVQNNLTFNADIDVVGRGFRGGTISLNPDGFCGLGSPDYYYDVLAPGPTWAFGGAEKGEGIGVLSTSKLGGKGRLVNGGGGGSKLNSGGGGGANFTAGGRGGFEYSSCAGVNNGLGGLGLGFTYTNNVIFAGGGGGCGDYNSGVGTNGDNGGGIIIVTTSTITGNNYLVNASGNTVIPVAGSSGDGAGGGGGGGAIFINAAAFSSPVTLISNGGTGGNQAAGACVGPGGGGGTGAILTNLASLAGINFSLIPGAAGVFTNGVCAMINYGALAGATNTVGPLTSRILSHTPDAITYTATAPTLSVCSGLALSFTAIVSGDTYSWTGPASFNATVPNPTITPSFTTNTGEYTLTVSSLNGCLSIITTSANVNPTPTVSIINFSVCSGQPINIIPVEAFASTYNWSGPNSFSSTLPTVSIPVSAPSMAGNYNLTVTSVAGCTASATGSIGVAVVVGITASANSPVCAGKTLSLSSSGGSGGLSYLWEGPAAYSSTLQVSTISTVSLSNAGNYTLTASVNGCSATPITVTVAVEAPPVISVSNVSVCSGNSVSLFASAPTGLNYNWNGPGGFTSSNQTFSFASASATLAGPYNVTVTSALGCTNVAPANLTVIITPSISVMSDQPVCAGGVLNFTTSGGVIYQLIGPNGFSSTSVNPSIINVSLAAAGNYTLTGAAASCSAVAITSVVIKTKPLATINNLNPVCAPRDFQLTAGGGATYTWTGPGSFTSTIQNPTISPSSLSSAGVYTVVVEGFNGCQATLTTTISVITTPTVSATGTTVCVGQPATLMSNGAVSYTWTGPGNYSTTTANAFIPVANNNSAGTYSLFVITVNTCTVGTTVNLSLHPVPAATISMPPRTCINSTIILQGSGGASYLWKGPASFTSAVQNPTLIPINMTYSGNYTLSILSAQGCTATATANLGLDPLPTGKLSGKVEGCAPFCSAFQYKPLGLSTIVSTTWITTTQYSIAPFFNVCFKTPGDFMIKGIIEDTLGCKSSNSFSVHARPKPEADFEYLPLKPIENIDNVVFRSTSTGDKIDTWSWFVENNFGNLGSGQSAAHFFESSGVYPIVHTVRNAWGCWDTLIKAIEIISDFNLFVPEAFTPNGDGKNEIFQPKGTGIDSYQFTVFDRWGQKIFQTNVFDEGWDGNFKGVPCKSDTYIWEINAVRITGKKKDLRGQVLLCR